MPMTGAAVQSHVIAIQHGLLRAIDAIAERIHPANEAAVSHLETGLVGEEEALFYLRRRGYVIVARRWKTPKIPGDVDLIGWDGASLCFIEVKTRTGRTVVPAEFAVDEHKQRVLRSMAAVFRKRLPKEAQKETPYRFDVVSVYLPGSGAGQNARPAIELLQGAFGSRAN